MYDFAQVQALLYEAGRALQAQSVRGCWPSDYRSSMPEALRDPEDLRYAETEFEPSQPTTAEMTRAEMVEGWIRQMPVRTPVQILRRKVVLDGMLVDPRTDQPKWSFKRLGDKHSLSADWIKQVWEAGVDALVTIANREASSVKVSMVARIRVASLRQTPAPCTETIRRIKQHRMAGMEVA